MMDQVIAVSERHPPEKITYNTVSNIKTMESKVKNLIRSDKKVNDISLKMPEKFQN